MFEAMTDEEVQEFISGSSRTGKLATVRADGRPHCMPIWCCFEDEHIYFMTMNTTVKARNIARDKRVSLTFDNESFPFDFVSIEGEAEVVDVSEAERLEFATKIAARYVPAGRAEEFGQRNAVPEELVIRIKPLKYISAKNLAD